MPRVTQVVLANQTYWNDALGTFLPNPWCWLGNEPSMLLPWSHAWAGPAHAWRAQFWPRWHLRTYYAPSAALIPGNDDYGGACGGWGGLLCSLPEVESARPVAAALSSWGVWAFLGLYPVPGMGLYVLGSPVFANATVAVPTGACVRRWP